MVRSRTAQGSDSVTAAMAIVFATRRAVVSGTMPMPTLHSTSRQTASKLSSCTRRRRGRPLRAAFAARKTGEIVIEDILEADLDVPGQRMIARDHEHET